MKRVKFTKNFFSPKGTRLRKNRWHNVPDEWDLPMKPDPKDKTKRIPDYELDASVVGLPAEPVSAKTQLPPPVKASPNGTVAGRTV